MTLAAQAGAALRELDHAIAARPHMEGHSFSAATVALCAVRNAVAAMPEADAAGELRQQRLAHLNGVISVVLAGHFPIGPVPWQELEKARSWLAEFVAGLEA